MMLLKHQRQSMQKFANDIFIVEVVTGFKSVEIQGSWDRALPASTWLKIML